MPLHRDTRPDRERAREVCERAGEAEVVEDLRAQLLRGSADIFEARLDGRLRFAECRVLLLRGVLCEALEQEEHAGQLRPGSTARVVRNQSSGTW